MLVHLSVSVIACFRSKTFSFFDCKTALSKIGCGYRVRFTVSTRTPFSYPLCRVLCAASRCSGLPLNEKIFFADRFTSATGRGAQMGYRDSSVAEARSDWHLKRGVLSEDMHL